MSKFSDRAEQFYMEQFKDMFNQEKDKEKAQKQLRKKLKKVNDEVIFEDVLSTIAEIAEKNFDIFNGTKFAKKTKKIINEAFGDEEEMDMEDDVPESTDPDDEPMENEEDEIPEDEKDDMDKADEILQDLDLEELDNATRLELIRNIIDSAQNMADEEDEMDFDSFIEELKGVMDEFEYDEEPEGEEGTEEFGDEEEPEFEEEPEGEEGEEEPVEGEEESEEEEEEEEEF